MNDTFWAVKFVCVVVVADIDCFDDVFYMMRRI